MLLEALAGKGWANFYQGNYDLALKDLNRALENIDQTTQTYRRYIFRGKAYAYLGLGDKETAVGLINRIREFDNTYQPEDDLTLICYATGDKENAWRYRGGNGYLGVRVKDYRKGSIVGGEVTEVIQSSPAQKAALLIGDVIIRIDNDPITESAGFVKKSRALNTGTTARVAIIREDIEREVLIKIESAEPFLESDPLIAKIVKKSHSEAFRDKSTSYSIIRRISVSPSLDRATRVFVSPDGRQIYYVANTGGIKNQWGTYSGGQWSVWTNERRISPELSQIGWALCNDDGSHVAYPGQSLGTWAVWIDGNKVSPEFDEISYLRFVPNNSKVAYRGKIGQQYSVWVNEQKVSTDFEDVSGVAVSPDGLKIAYGAKRWGKYSLWVNEKKVSPDLE